MRQFRTFVMATTITLAAGSLPANAAKLQQLTYTDTEVVQKGIPTFDPALGRLAKSTLSVNATKFRLWDLYSPDYANQTISVHWSIDSLYSLSANGISMNGKTFTYFPLTGTGSANVTFDKDGFGQFETNLTGSANYNLDKSAVLLTDNFPYFIVTGDDTGFYNNSNDVISLDVPSGIRTLQLSGACGSHGIGGDDFCGSVGYKVTYFYNPSAVPEPSSWALILLGFGVIGGAIRRRKAAFALSVI